LGLCLRFGLLRLLPRFELPALALRLLLALGLLSSHLFLGLSLKAGPCLADHFQTLLPVLELRRQPPAAIMAIKLVFRSVVGFDRV
jgi:hypothetical protein